MLGEAKQPADMLWMVARSVCTTMKPWLKPSRLLVFVQGNPIIPSVFFSGGRGCRNHPQPIFSDPARGENTIREVLTTVGVPDFFQTRREEVFAP